MQENQKEDIAKKNAMAVAKLTKSTLEDGIMTEYGDDSKMIAKSRVIAKSIANPVSEF